MNKSFYYILFIFIAFSLFFSSSSTKALTKAEQIQLITKSIAELQEKIYQIKNNASFSIPNFVFTRNLQYKDVGEDVRQLQIILNKDPDTRITGNRGGSPGMETMTFGILTHAAVIRFQNKYKSEILTPVGLTNATGFVRQMTRTKLSALSSTIISNKPTNIINTITPGFGYQTYQTDQIFINSTPSTPQTPIILPTFTLTYNTNNNGSITGTTTQRVNQGSTGLDVTAVAATGFYFTTWSDGVLTASRTDTNIQTDINVVAYFEANPIPPSSFKIWDSILGYPGRPDSLGSNIRKDIVISSDFFSGYDWANGILTTPEETKTRAWANQAALNNQILIINIEAWEIDVRYYPEVEVQSTIDKFSQIIDWAKSAEPNLKLGIYSYVPIRAFWPSFPNEPGYNEWVAANERLSTLANKVDYFFPSLYTFYANQNAWWETYAKSNIDIVKKYNKPIYPFIMPRYHESATGGIASQLMSQSEFLFQLDTLKKYADGIVLWDGGSETWSDTLPWYQALNEFSN